MFYWNFYDYILLKLEFAFEGEEEKQQMFSPSFPELPQIHEEGGAAINYSVMASNANASIDINDHQNIMESSQNKDFEHEQRENGGTQRKSALTQSVLSVDDFCCSTCNGLLYRPVVLNCGDGEICI